VTNSSVTGLPDIRAVIGDKRLAVFGHVRRLPEGTPAHDALHASVELLARALRQILAGKESLEDHEVAGYVTSSKVTCLTAQEAWTSADDREG